MCLLLQDSLPDKPGRSGPQVVWECAFITTRTLCRQRCVALCFDGSCACAACAAFSCMFSVFCDVCELCFCCAIMLRVFHSPWPIWHTLPDPAHPPPLVRQQRSSSSTIMHTCPTPAHHHMTSRDHRSRSVQPNPGVPHVVTLQFRGVRWHSGSCCAATSDPHLAIPTSL